MLNPTLPLRAAAVCRRLHTRARIIYHRWRLHEARKDANVIEAEMLSAPHELSVLRHYIAEKAACIEALEGRP
jgi:hypothetical protein